MLDLTSSQINRTHVIVFSQEVPNFLRGYHKCSIEDAVQMGSMLFKAKYKDEKQPFDQIAYVLKKSI